MNPIEKYNVNPPPQPSTNYQKPPEINIFPSVEFHTNQSGEAVEKTYSYKFHIVQPNQQSFKEFRIQEVKQSAQGPTQPEKYVFVADRINVINIVNPVSPQFDYSPQSQERPTPPQPIQIPSKTDDLKGAQKHISTPPITQRNFHPHPIPNPLARKFPSCGQRFGDNLLSRRPYQPRQSNSSVRETNHEISNLELGHPRFNDFRKLMRFSEELASNKFRGDFNPSGEQQLFSNNITNQHITEALLHNSPSI